MTNTLFLVRREMKMNIQLHDQISVFLHSKYLFCQSTFFLASYLQIKNTVEKLDVLDYQI